MTTAQLPQSRRTPAAGPGSSVNIPYTLMVGLDRQLFEALRWYKQTFPRKSKSDFVRDALYLKFATDFPQVFNRKSEQIVTAE
jgi:hypothetical protein